MRLEIGVVLLGLGCGATPPSEAPCAASECRQEAVLQAFEENPEEGLTLIAGLPDEVEQMAALSQMISRYPAKVGPLCPQLPRGPTRERCVRAANRNHLHVPPTRDAFPNGEAVRGGPNVEMAHLLMRPRTLERIQADAGPCTGTPDATSCLLATARLEAAKGTVPGVAALCMAVPLGADGSRQWRSECFFQAAEAWFRSSRSGLYPSAVELCSESGQYLVHCNRHLVQAMSSLAPAADIHDPAAWAKVSQGVGAILEHWEGARAGTILSSEAWAFSVENAVRVAETPSGDLVDQIPPEALPHLRASLAARLLSDGYPKEMDLEAWAGEVERVLAVRVGRDGLTQRLEPTQPPRRIWPVRRARDAALPVVGYRGPAIRVLGEDPAADVRICVIEAAVRLKPPAHHLLQEGTQHPSERVRWTAKNLTHYMHRLERNRLTPGPGVNR